MLDLFISHAESDAELVRDFVKVLTERFYIGKDTLRCSSHQTYGIQYGSDPVVTLKKDLKKVKLVIPIFTPNSYRKPWVHAEIGAAWIQSSNTIPILTGSIKWNDVVGPLFARAKPVILSDRDQVQDLLRKVQDIR